VSLGFAVLLWLHIVSAVGWLGATMVFAMLIGPTLPSLTPAARSELVVKLLPKYIRYAEIFTFITPIFGLTLALYISHGSWSVFNPAVYGNLGLYLSIGALLSLVAWAISFGLVAPAGRRVVWFHKQMMKNPAAPPPAGLQRASTRLRIASATGLVVLLVIVVCMVAAATL
jgi:uncharacterized membrane protein